METTEQQEIMQRLKAETAKMHANAENQDLERAMMRGKLPKEVFVHSLEQRLLVHEALEAQLQRHRDVPAINAVFADHHVHSGRIREDLRFFGSDPTGITPLPATRAAIDMVNRTGEEQPVALLGIHYVFEGSTNGARFIAKAVKGAYQLGNGQGTRYLESTGEDQPANWAAFKAAMNGHGFTPEEEDAIVEHAKATFDAVAAIDGELYQAPAEE